jgi:hypothetical protein
MHDEYPGPGEGCCVKINERCCVRIKKRRARCWGHLDRRLVIAGWLAADAAVLRRAYADLASHFRCEAMGLSALPRIWHV